MRARRPLLAAAGLATLLGTVQIVDGPAAAQPPADAAPKDAQLARATFAGGCFWCMEPPFDELPGVTATISGYIGGRVKNPTYEEVSSGASGHLEAVQVLYDPGRVDYARLLDVFWRNVDPTDAGGQFCDRGEQYGTAIFAHTAEQRAAAAASKRALEDAAVLAKPIVTPIREATQFYPAEEYHQDYYRKNPLRYKYYRRGCGRDRTLARVWANRDTGASTSDR